MVIGDRTAQSDWRISPIKTYGIQSEKRKFTNKNRLQYVFHNANHALIQTLISFPSFLLFLLFFLFFSFFKFLLRSPWLLIILLSVVFFFLLPVNGSRFGICPSPTYVFFMHPVSFFFKFHECEKCENYLFSSYTFAIKNSKLIYLFVLYFGFSVFFNSMTQYSYSFLHVRGCLMDNSC